VVAWHAPEPRACRSRSDRPRIGSAIGTGTSSRNSEVIHAGIYYPRGSLKAKLCVAGRQALYPFLAQHGVPHRRSGKFIVATEAAQIPALEKFRAQAAENGVTDLKCSPPPKLARWSRSSLRRGTGVSFDGHRGQPRVHARIARRGRGPRRRDSLSQPASRRTHPERSNRAGSGWRGSHAFARQTVVNCAGLFAQDVARSIEGFPAERIPPTHYCKGNYFGLRAAPPFPGWSTLRPRPPVSACTDPRSWPASAFGPDVEWIERIDYDVDLGARKSFTRPYAATGRIERRRLATRYSGIRPKMRPRGEPACDFLIQGPTDHGVARLVNLFGIESPGLTAALAIGDAVRDLLGD